MSSPFDRLISDNVAQQMQADAQKALAHRDSLSLEEQYFAHATLAFAVDRQARLEMAAGAGK
jgi:hypothetical protein